MNRKWILLITIIALVIAMTSACGTSEQANDQNSEPSETTAEAPEATADMKLLIGNQELKVYWENNDAVTALKEKVQEETLTIDMSMYSDFEQVGDLGFDLPANDKQIQTKAGDIMLYAGDKIVVFYGTNSWDYTPLGKIQDKSPEELAELLGNGDVSITLRMGE